MRLLPGALLLLPFLSLLVGRGSDANPLFTELTTMGLVIDGQGTRLTLPTPFMADGLSAAEQHRVMANLPGCTVPVDEFIRLSPVAPVALNIVELPTPDPQTPARRISLCFVAQGTLEALARGDFLEQLLNSGRKDAQIETLVAPPSTLNQQGLGRAHVTLPLMDRVVLRGTTLTHWSRTADALLLAGKIDPDYTGHTHWPNQWQLLTRNDQGQIVPTGPPHAYAAAGYCFKFTRLIEPADAIFAECHLLFVEPVAWFDGANLLRSKLPLVLQSKVRSLRRDLLR